MLLHSAKYFDFDMTIYFIASDLRDKVAKIVELAKHPKKDTFQNLRASVLNSTYNYQFIN